MKPLTNYSIKGITLKIPSAFLTNYQTLFKQNNLQGEIKFIQYYFLFLNTLYIQFKKNSEYEYANLYNKYLIILLGKYYKRYINNLIKVGIIEPDNLYNKGKKSLGYKFAGSIHQAGEYGELTIHNKVINNRIAKFRKAKAKDKKERNKQQLLLQNKPDNINIVKHIKTFLNCYHSDKAKEYINNNSKLTDTQKAKANKDINKISKGDINLKYLVSGRKTDIITNCKKELRMFYNTNNFQGELFCIDLSACQPVLLTYFFKQYGIKNKYRRVNGKSYLWNDEFSNDKNPYYAIQKLWFKEYKQFIPIIKVKQKVINYLNGKLFHNKKSKLHPIITKYYPAVGKLLLAMKKDNHRNYAKLMHKLESDIFIQDILKPLAKELFILCIHDCLIIERHNYTRVKNFINEVLYSYGLFHFSFKVTKLSTGELLN